MVNRLWTINHNSMPTFTIHLHQLNFFAFHGVYEAEKIIGNNFELNIDVSFESDKQVKNLEQTIDYVAIYEIVKDKMAIPTKLLETLAETIADEIYRSDTRIISIRVNINKINAPIENFSGRVGVTCQKNYP